MLDDGSKTHYIDQNSTFEQLRYILLTIYNRVGDIAGNSRIYDGPRTHAVFLRQNKLSYIPNRSIHQISQLHEDYIHLQNIIYHLCKSSAIYERKIGSDIGINKLLEHFMFHFKTLD